jgi:hypothetical protein
LKPALGPPVVFCPILWRQIDGSHVRIKSVRKDTLRYVAAPFVPLCCVYRDFGGVRATLSGGNPPGFKSNHTDYQIKLVYKSSRYPAKKSVNC